MTNHQILSPIVRVLLEQTGTEELIEYTVQTDNRDMVRWDLTRARKGWPSVQDGAGFLWMTFLAWSALARTGAVTDTFDAFSARCVAVNIVDKDGEPITEGDDDYAGAQVGPTQTGPEPVF